MPPETVQGFGPASTVGLLSLCPLLAGSTSLLSALTMSAAFACVLCASAVSLSACRRLIAPDAELASILIFAAAWTTVVDLLLQAGLYPLRDALGIYVPVMAGNFLLLAHLEEKALTAGPLAALRVSFSTGMRVAVIVVAAGVLRELSATGALLSDAQLPGWQGGVAFLPFKLPVMASAAGAFFALSILAAMLNRFRPGQAD